MRNRDKTKIIGKDPVQTEKKPKVIKPAEMRKVADKPIEKKSTKRSRRRIKDPTYRPGQEKLRRNVSQSKSTTHRNILRMRTTTATVFTSPKGSKRQLQTSVLFQIPYSPQTHAKVEGELAKIPTYKAPQELILNPAGSPIAIKTESGDILERKKTYESFMYFDSAPSSAPESSQPIITQLPTDSAFFQSDQYKKLKKIQDTYKLQDKTITEEVIAKRQAEKKIRKGRATSQSSKMVEEGVSAKWGKATDYVKATELFLFDDTIQAEWLHKIPYAEFGEDSQTDANLVAGTEHANTDMMFVEEYIPYLKQKYPNGIRLRVKADLIPGTHIATTITYQIITPDCHIPPLVFNAQDGRKPHFVILEFMKVFIDAIMDRKDPAPTPMSNPPLPFFKRKRVEIEAKDEPVKKKARKEPTAEVPEHSDEAPEVSAPRTSSGIVLFSSKRKLDFSDDAMLLDENDRLQQSSDTF